MAALDYETGIASSPADLLSKFETFIAAVTDWSVSTPASGRVIRNDGAGIYVGMNTDTDEVFLRGALGYNGANAWNAQTNHSGFSSACLLGAGPFTAYHFFAGTEESQPYACIVVETSTGIYSHIYLGALVKFGGWTGGTVVDCTRWYTGPPFANLPTAGANTTLCDTVCSDLPQAQLWCDVDAKTNNWQRGNVQSNYNMAYMIGSTRYEGLGHIFEDVGYQRWNLRQHMAPMQYFVNRASSLRSPAGRLGGIRSIGMQGLTPGETISVGGESWRVFPVKQRTTVSGDTGSSVPSSGYQGYAYLLPGS